MEEINRIAENYSDCVIEIIDEDTNKNVDAVNYEILKIKQTETIIELLQEIIQRLEK